MTDRFSPLHRVHEAAGATFTDFAGWQMPVRYASDLEEHHAVRASAGLFDISHMGEVRVEGPDAAAMLDYALCGKLSATVIGQAKYSLLLNDLGTVLDDLVVYRRGEQAFLVVPNAGNRALVFAELTARAAGFDVAVVDESDDTALLALQGPRALEILGAVAELSVEGDLAELGYYRALEASFAGEPAYVARTGYTGEDGFEVYLPNAQSEPFWAAVMAAGAALGEGTVVPAGLAARDTLRLEAGMPLYGHELDDRIHPHQLGMGRVVALSKAGDFVGRAASEAYDPTDRRVLVGLAAEGRRAARADSFVFADDSDEGAEPIGSITSGVLSPTLGHPIALAFVDAAFAEPGTVLSVDIRGKRHPFTVTELPFYSRKKR